MPQFDVYRNMDPTSRTNYPLLLDVQSEGWLGSFGQISWFGKWKDLPLS